MLKANTLRRELLTAFAVVFTGALVAAMTGVLLLYPSFDTPVRAILYLLALLGADLLIFFIFGRWLVQTRVLFPLDRIVEEAEGIAAGDYARRIPAGETEEIARLSSATSRMAERLITHQMELARNVQSLEETNRELTTARDELIRAEKMASLGQMAAGVAHEIGNPLAAIMGNVDLLKRRAEGREADLVTATSEQVRRIDRIVRGLLDYSRAREPKVRPIDVNGVVRSALDLLASQARFRGVEVTMELAAVPAVAADPFQLEQVLVNLLLNSADAMLGSEDHCVTITTSTHLHQAPTYLPARRKDDLPGIDYSHRRRFNRPERVPRVNPFAAGDRIVEIQVTDTGTGIPDELLDQIFEPFMTTKEPGKGTGLGLAVCARLVDAMEGTIRATNIDGGARFTLQLPASTEPAETVAP